jgi:hypothetical protein
MQVCYQDERDSNGVMLSATDNLFCFSYTLLDLFEKCNRVVRESVNENKETGTFPRCFFAMYPTFILLDPYFCRKTQIFWFYSLKNVLIRSVSFHLRLIFESDSDHIFYRSARWRVSRNYESQNLNSGVGYFSVSYILTDVCP